MPTCPSCKREIAISGKFCPECGAPLPAASAVPPPESAPTMARETIASAPDSRPPSSHPSSSSIHGRFEPGTRLGTRYRVVGLLGRGGMGEVYRADDLELNQSVALKFLPERVARNAADLARLRAEVRTARQIAHPNVCRTYDIAEADGQVFVVMEYIDGEDLASVLRRLGRPSPDKALEIARQLCLGLGAAHENGVLHRDLKPANIMIDGRGRVRITDFGLAGTAEEIAAEGGIAGTPAYMAPEQQRSGGGSAQSDIYSLGLVLYEIFTGKKVTDMTPRPDPSRRGGDSSVRTPSSLVADIDPAVERVILRCLEHDPARRPQSAYAIFGALPGGDPLAAAVAAGETPSPELVANAGVEGSIRPAYAIAAVAFVLAAIAVLSILERPYFTGLDRPPQSLSVKAEELLTSVTGRAMPRFSAQGFILAPPPADTTKPRSTLYWGRWSPLPMAPVNIHDLDANMNDPPQAYAGSGTVILSTRGRLMALSTVPVLAPDTSRSVVDWAALLKAAGSDIATAVPVAVPDSFLAQADTVAAWRISAPQAPETTFVVAALKGRVIQASTLAGHKPVGDLSIRPKDELDREEGSLLGWFQLALYILVPFVGGVILTRRNLRAGRGDIRGALLVGLSITIFYVLEYIFSVPAGELGLYRILTGIFWQAPGGHALLHATLMTLAYLAIEPYVRRLWPSALVSWARLVAGRLRDPIVGRDLLIGTALAFLLLVMGEGTAHLLRVLGLQRAAIAPPTFLLDSTIGPQKILAATSHGIAVAVLFGTFLFTILVILRFVLRRNWLAAVALVLLATMLGAELGEKESLINVLSRLVAMGALVFVAVRFGYLALIVGLAVTNCASTFPWTTDLGAWFAPQVVLSWGIMIALLAYGFATAVAGRSLFRDPLSDPVIGGRALPK